MAGESVKPADSLKCKITNDRGRGRHTKREDKAIVGTSVALVANKSSDDEMRAERGHEGGESREALSRRRR